MSFRVRFTQEARADLLRLYDFLLDQDPPDVETAERALESIERAMQLLEYFPFSCRKAISHNPYLRELVIPFGSSGYVALFEIEPQAYVTILAVRRQRESDYH
ncbi:MAG TPA: type II toxin-antitoxin system RelE/ParE family toxin [Castellaniella sp.]|uniref:type II toxin-antitoxin system RelE/ParE family toxin n=1 Tax=Castellaniella sp. TaxID=1955812 RepID=UPI002EE74472